METPPAATALFRAPMTGWAFLEARGDRVVDLLQGQLTCDVREATATRAIPGAWCTPKGRVVCSLLLWRPGPGHALLQLSADLAEPVREALSRYAALSRVTLAATPLCCTGLLGPLPAAAGHEGEDGTLHPAGAGWLLRRDGLRHEYWGEGALPAWIAALPEAPESAWRLAALRAGEAGVQAATREMFLPQMLGYDETGAVSFRKGCYTGQEVVARARYRGGVKRHLRRITGAGAPPAPGSALHAGTRAAGTVVDAAADGAGGFEALAVLSDEAAAATGTLRTEAGSDARLLD